MGVKCVILIKSKLEERGLTPATERAINFLTGAGTSSVPSHSYIFMHYFYRIKFLMKLIVFFQMFDSDYRIGFILDLG